MMQNDWYLKILFVSGRSRAGSIAQRQDHWQASQRPINWLHDESLSVINRYNNGPCTNQVHTWQREKGPTIFPFIIWTKQCAETCPSSLFYVCCLLLAMCSIISLSPCVPWQHQQDRGSLTKIKLIIGNEVHNNREEPPFLCSTSQKQKGSWRCNQSMVT